jgi:hypothetical protein
MSYFVRVMDPRHQGSVVRLQNEQRRHSRRTGKPPGCVGSRWEFSPPDEVQGVEDRTFPRLVRPNQGDEVLVEV